MSFKKSGNEDAIKKFYELYYSTDQINTFIKAENFLPATTSGVKLFQSDPALAPLKVYLDTLPNAHLTPTDDPEWDKVKLALQQTLGLAVAPNGDPQKYLDKLQAQAEAGK
jgi:multiple sugar transport system substrate-binding protein